MDSFSGDTEVPSKRSISNVAKETAGIEKANFLSVLNLEHSRLPNSFDVEQGILSGIVLLRLETANRNIEVGGVIFKDNNNEPKVRVIIPRSDLKSRYLSIAPYRVIDERNIDFYLKRHQEFEKGLKRGIFEEQAFFVDSNTAREYRHFFEALIQEGKEIIIDGTPIAPVHTHPSGTLPSQVDFSHTTWGFEPAEIVVTSGWTYFLIPTKQTPDLSGDSSSKLNLSNFKTMIDEEDKQEQAVTHLIRSANDRQQPIVEEAARNSVRLKSLTDDSIKHNVGFYVLEKGKSVATRIA